MLHLYAVVSAPDAPPLDGGGLEDAPLVLVAAEALAAVVSEHAAAVDATEETVLRHAAVVERVARAAPAVLPARYGDVLPDEEAVRSRLLERKDGLAGALERVRGCVELGLRVALREGAREAPSPAARPAGGREYMSALLERAAAEASRTTSIHEPLARLAEAAVADRRASGALVLTAAYLVRSGRVDAVRAEVARLQEEHPELALLCTGPWPPYSFAEPEATT